MTSNEMYNDIKSVLNDITLRKGTDYFKFGLVANITQLPKKTPKLTVWYFNSPNEASIINKKLHSNYGLEYEYTTGQYLYTYEIESQDT